MGDKLAYDPGFSLSRLDVGEGKEINLEAKCSRSKLQSQCIKYLGPVSVCNHGAEKAQLGVTARLRVANRTCLNCAEGKRGLRGRNRGQQVLVQEEPANHRHVWRTERCKVDQIGRAHV